MTTTAMEKRPRFEVTGEIAQAVTLRLARDERVWACRGAIVSLGDGVRWHLEIPGGAGAAVGRVLAGEGLSLTRIHAEREGAEVVLAAGTPGKITAWSLEEQGPVVCTRGSFLAALGEVSIVPTVTRRAGAALFGGAGFFLQRLSGKGTVFIHGAGDFVRHVLAEGESIQVSTGNLAAFAQSVDYDIVGVQGCRNIVFGGEGLFMARLKGPGPVLTQTLKRSLPSRSRSSSSS